MDYRQIIAEAEKAMENGYSLTDEQREVALDAIIGYFNHVRISRQIGLRKIIHSHRRFDDKNGHDFEETIYNWINNRASEVNDVIDYFPVLASLGYKPSKDFSMLREAEDFEFDYRLNAEKDDELPFSASLFYEFEKSAFLPCELVKYKSKAKEVLNNIFNEE